MLTKIALSFSVYFLAIGISTYVVEEIIPEPTLEQLVRAQNTTYVFVSTFAPASIFMAMKSYADERYHDIQKKMPPELRFSYEGGYIAQAYPGMIVQYATPALWNFIISTRYEFRIFIILIYVFISIFIVLFFGINTSSALLIIFIAPIFTTLACLVVKLTISLFLLFFGKIIDLAGFVGLAMLIVPVIMNIVQDRIQSLTAKLIRWFRDRIC